MCSVFIYQWQYKRFIDKVMIGAEYLERSSGYFLVIMLYYTWCDRAQMPTHVHPYDLTAIHLQTTMTVLTPCLPSRAPNTLRLKYNGLYSVDDVHKYISFNENYHILIKITSQLVPKSLINNISALVKEMACSRLARTMTPYDVTLSQKCKPKALNWFLGNAKRCIFNHFTTLIKHRLWNLSAWKTWPVYFSYFVPWASPCHLGIWYWPCSPGIFLVWYKKFYQSSS